MQQFHCLQHILLIQSHLEFDSIWKQVTKHPEHCTTTYIDKQPIKGQFSSICVCLKNIMFLPIKIFMYVFAYKIFMFLINMHKLSKDKCEIFFCLIEQAHAWCMSFAFVNAQPQTFSIQSKGTNLHRSSASAQEPEKGQRGAQIGKRREQW